LTASSVAIAHDAQIHAELGLQKPGAGIGLGDDNCAFWFLPIAVQPFAL
jgi:hypothetical protein